MKFTTQHFFTSNIKEFVKQIPCQNFSRLSYKSISIPALGGKGGGGGVTVPYNAGVALVASISLALSTVHLLFETSIYFIIDGRILAQVEARREVWPCRATRACHSSPHLSQQSIYCSKRPLLLSMYCSKRPLFLFIFLPR